MGMVEICDECGLPMPLCSGIALACIEIARMQGLSYRETVRVFRPVLEASFREAFDMPEAQTADTK